MLKRAYITICETIPNIYRLFFKRVNDKIVR